MNPAQSGAGKSPGLRLGRWRDWLIGALSLLALVVVVQTTVGWGALLTPWREFPPLLLVWLFLLTALSYVLRGLRIRDYFGAPLRGHFPSVLRLSILHNTANNLLPMRTGELVFPWLMRREFGYDMLDAGVSLMWIRLFDLHVLGLVGVWILDLQHPSWWWGGVALLWLCALVVVVWLARRSGPAARHDEQPWWLRLFGRLCAAAPRRSGRLVRVYLWTMLTWGLKFLAFASVLQHFLPVDFWRVLAGVMGGELSSVLPFHGVAGSGSYELAAVAALVPLGVDVDQALAGAVNLHLFLLCTTLLLGGAALFLPRTHFAKNN